MAYGAANLPLPGRARRACVVLLLAAAGCTNAPDILADDAGVVVGPAPLRRLANNEYLNALGDLFPDLGPLLPPLPALPADTIVAGFENAAEAQQPSDVLIARFEAIANLYAQAAARDTASVGALVQCSDWSTDDLAATCAGNLLDGIGARIFRRPLDDEERQRFLTRFSAWTAAVDFAGAVQLTLAALLQSPQFLYRAEPEAAGSGAPAVGSVIAVEPYAMASRLSFFLWESVPDAALLEAASSGALGTVAELRAQGERMLADPRARRVYYSFHRQWLGLDQVLGDEDIARSPDVDPLWTPATRYSANTESQLFIENVLLQGGSLRDVLTSTRAWLDPESARIYGISGISPPGDGGAMAGAGDGGVAAPTDGGNFVESTLPAGERAGILTRIAFLAGTSHVGATSPPIRGAAIESRLLCELPGTPPPGADLTPPTTPPDAGVETNRMLFEQRTSPAACHGCHLSLNGLGFGLESYSASGGWQATDHGLPVDDSGQIYQTDVDRSFHGGIELSAALAQSRTVHRCATSEWLRYAFGRAPTDAETPLIESLTDDFLDGGLSVHDLLLEIVASPSFRLRVVQATQ